MFRRGGQDRSLEWFGQGRFTFLAPKDGHRDDAPIARDGFDKSQNVLISLPSVLFRQHRRVNAPYQATLLPCKTRYLVIAGRLLQVTRWAARAERNKRLRSFTPLYVPTSALWPTFKQLAGRRLPYTVQYFGY